MLHSDLLALGGERFIVEIHAVIFSSGLNYLFLRMNYF